MARLPRAVQQQVEAANAILAEAAKPTEAAAPLEAEAPTAAPELAPATEPPVQATAPAPAPAPSTSEVNWEHKFKTLQGIMATEVRTAQQQNKELNARLQEAISRVEQLAAKPPAPEAPQSPTLDPKDIDNFGQDLVEMVQRQTQAVLGRVAGKIDAVVADFEKRISAMEKALKGTTETVAMTAEEVFFTKLTGLVPDWEPINADERFINWLQEVDPVYGQARQAALTAAQQNLDVNRVANVFKAFKALLPAAPKVDPLAKQVSPKTNAASAPPAPTEKRVFTQREVTDFYNALATGKYRGREREAAQIEAQINDALADGRIR